MDSTSGDCPLATASSTTVGDSLEDDVTQEEAQEVEPVLSRPVPQCHQIDHGILGELIELLGQATAPEIARRVFTVRFLSVAPNCDRVVVDTSDDAYSNKKKYIDLAFNDAKGDTTKKVCNLPSFNGGVGVKIWSFNQARNPRKKKELLYQ